MHIGAKKLNPSVNHELKSISNKSKCSNIRVTEVEIDHVQNSSIKLDLLSI